MERVSIILSEVSQVQKVKNHVFSYMHSNTMKNRSCCREVTYKRGRVKEGS
jgi:hypothetical protein